MVEPTQDVAVPHLHMPPEHVGAPEAVHAETVDEHLHKLLLASQCGAVVDPTHDVAVPHLHTPPVTVSSPMQETVYNKREIQYFSHSKILAQ